MASPRCASVPWKAGLRLVGDPVDVATGAQTSFETDFRLVGKHIPVSWVRYYDSRRHQVDRGIGHGFWFAFDLELRFELDGLTLVGEQGDSVEFPFLSQDGERVLRAGYELERISSNVYRVHPPDDDPSLEFRFDRDLAARPCSMFYEDGRWPPVRLQYDKGELAAIQVDASKRLVFEYVGKKIAGAALLEEGTTKKLRLVRYGYDQQGRLVEVENAYGGVLRYEYDANNRLVRTINRCGFSFFFEYDEDGRCIHTWGEDGVEEYRFEYKATEHLTVVTRGDGAVSSYYYDDQNELVQIIDPCGGVTAYLKDDRGQVVTEVDPNGNESEILYDDRDLPYAKRDPQGYVRLLPEDPSPHPLSHEMPESPVQWEHGEWPGPIEAIPEGIPVGYWLPRWLIDTWGKTPTVALPKSTPVKDEQGLLLREERKDGKTRRWGYDQNGFERSYTDLDGRTTRYERGSWNFLLREIAPQGSITEYGWTKSEQMAAIVDPLGTRSDYTYDLKDRLVEVRRHGKVREAYVYDAADNLIEKRDGQGRPLLKLSIGYGNVIEQRRLSSGDVEDFDYLHNGRLASAKNQAGTVSFAYDSDGQRTADERDGKGVRHRFGVERLLETTVLGRFVTKYIQADATTTIVLDPGAQTQRLRLLAPGLLERACSNDIEELSHYDPNGRCLLKAAGGPRLSNGSGGWARRFAYSGEGDLLRRDDTVRGTTTFEHDEAHQLSKVLAPDGSVHEYAYDRAGNLLKAPGHVARIQAGNRLLEANGDQFSYNERDHVAERRSPKGTTTYTYDSRDLLKAIDGPGISYQAVHDGLGRRARKIVNGRTWHYYWDTDRLAAEIFPDGQLRVYVYPDANALVPMLFLEYESVDAEPETGKRYHIYTDHLGCPELVLDDGGHAVWRASIDPYGTARVEIGHDFHQPLRWPGHYYDAETGLHDNRFRTYSPELGRYLQSDPSGTEGGVNLYAYTKNPLRAVDLLGLVDCPNARKNKKSLKDTGPDQEGVKLVGVDAKTRRIAASKRTDSEARRARMKVITEFLKQHGQEYDRKTKKMGPPTAKSIRKQLKGHDLNHPVKVGPPPKCDSPLTQWQRPGQHQGSYYTDAGTTPSEAGIASYARDDQGRFVKKVPTEYQVDEKTPYLKSRCAPVDDDWSVSGMDVPAKGGGTQRVIGDRNGTTPSED